MATPDKRSTFDVRHPFFRPFWRRCLATAALLLWALFELSNNQLIWATVFGLAGLHLFIQFFVKFDPAEYEPETNDKTET